MKIKRSLISLVLSLGGMALTLLWMRGSVLCAGTLQVCPTCAYTTIQAAVNAAQAGDTIHVFAGVYAESVDLSAMSPQGNISLITVDGSGTPTPGTVVVNGGAKPAIGTSSTFSGDVSIDGFGVNSTGDDGIYVGVSGGVIIRHVTANGNGGDGIEVNETGGDVEITHCTTSNNTGDGIYVHGADGNVSISHCTADGNGDDGFNVEDVTGSLTIADCTATQNIGSDGDGFDVVNIDGNVDISHCIGSQNDDDAFWIWTVAGSVRMHRCLAQDNGWDGFGIEQTGDVTITNCTAQDNSEDGFDFDTAGDITIRDSTSERNNLEDDSDGFEIRAGGYLSISRVTAKENSDDGIFIWSTTLYDIAIRDSQLRDNDGGGVELSSLEGANAFTVSGSIICNNVDGGIKLGTDLTLDAEGNWWGHASGPTHPNNPGGSGDAVVDSANGGAGTVDFAPWIDTITVTASIDSPNIGQSTVITFQFSGGSETVFLGQGPGDLNGTPPFLLGTDNGTLISSTGTGITVTEVISGTDGALVVTLVPSTPGTATVTLDGPCNLDDSIVVQVADLPNKTYLPLVVRNESTQ